MMIFLATEQYINGSINDSEIILRFALSNIQYLGGGLKGKVKHLEKSYCKTMNSGIQIIQ